ncbi:hypothetical protein F5Y17DRAFT_435594 [Xylariaceae sp. FL0594]|nr:hypothetical protein F5Y17DRAFT_435594 [Xylariaceae sp. FL0594]
MAGRRRRADSVSTVASSADEAVVRHYQESSILKPVAPDSHSDDWPCFLLSDASVHRRDGSLVNQLHVDLEGPFIVRGRLEVEKDNEKYLVHRDMKRKSFWIQIETSNAFSVGVKDDSLSVPVVWASGAAGWYEISPADGYRTICHTMFQGVRLHYSLLDEYEVALEALQKSKKKKRATYADLDLNLNELLFKYALHEGDGLVLPEAYERLHEQAVFLLSHFPKDTGVHKYLSEKFPDVVRKLGNKTATDSTSIKVSQPPALKAFVYSAREKSGSLEAADGKKRGRGRPRSSAPRSNVVRTERAGELSDGDTNLPKQKYEAKSAIPARPKQSRSAVVDVVDDDVIMVDPPRPGPVRTEESASSGNLIVDTLNEARRQLARDIAEGTHKKQLHQIAAKSWQNKVYLACAIKDYKAVEEIFLYHAPALVKLLGAEWHDTQIYKWVQERASSKPTFNLITEQQIQQLVRRNKKGARGGPTEKPVGQASRKIAVSQYAGKQTPQRGRASGKAAGLRPSTGSKKRLRNEDDMDIDDDGSFKKRLKKSHYFPGEDEEDEEDENENDTSDSVSEDSDSHDDVAGDDEASESKNPGEAIQRPMTILTIRAEKLPTAEPRGPNRTWACEEKGCGYVVRAADEAEGQELISVHIDEHDRAAHDMAQEMASSRVDLAVQEGARGHMPVSHLLDKIRKISDKSKRRDNTLQNGPPPTEGIKMVLLI